MGDQRVDLELGLHKGTNVVITGAGGHIGSVVVAAFISAGAYVQAWDISVDALESLREKLSNWLPVYKLDQLCSYVQVDVSDENGVRNAFAKSSEEMPVHCVVHMAALDLSVLEHHKSLTDMSAEQFRRTVDVNITGSFLVAREWARTLPNLKDRDMPNVSFVLVGSECGHFGERSNPDYASSKAGVQYGLLQSLKADIPRLYPGARINAVAPGAVDTPRYREECKARPKQNYEDAEATTALAKPVKPEVVARSIIFLASSNFSENVHGQILNIDSGKQGKLHFHEGEAAILSG